MSQAGYTLAETLAALVVIGLAMGSLTLAVQVLGALQRTTGLTVQRIEGVQATQVALEDLLAAGAPFRSAADDVLRGDAQSLSFACRAPRPCTATLETPARLRLFDGRASTRDLPLPTDGPVRFVYQGERSIGAVWPPLDGSRQALRSISIETDAAISLVQSRVRLEQPPACAFDPIMQDCQ